jgi:hypothetical protein
LGEEEVHVKHKGVESASAIPLALVQLVERLTPEEKRELALALDWEELQRY